MRSGKGKGSLVLLLSFAVMGSPLAGSLGNFESAVEKPAKKKDRSSAYYSDESDDTSSFSDGCATAGVDLVLEGLFYGGKWLVYDWWAHPDDVPVDGVSETAQVDESPGDAANEDYDFTEGELEGFKHKLGTPGLPYVRFDYRWQYLEHDLDANDYLLEAGYKHAALYGRVTRYEEASGEDLDIEQWYGMARFGGSDEFLFPGSFQIGAGLGWFSIKGDQTQEGPALTVPVMLYPNDWIGFEFRPAWAYINDKSIGDYDLSVSLGREFTHLRLGYRWFWIQEQGHWLDGPYAGISVSF